MATNGKKVYLVKLGQKSFGDGRRTFARIKHLNWEGGGAETGEHFAQIISSIFSLLDKHVKILL